MKEAPAVIDDDVVMVEPTEVIENNNKDTNKTLISTTAEDAIILDDEPSSETANEKLEVAPTSSESNTDKETSFVKLLKSNTLMSKIVKKCLNMPNNTGMSRVIYKTLLPLYKDVNHTLKMSESFTNILRKTLHNLKCDPDYKFLHIKRLCEELKEGMFKKKVPFVTIATNITKNPRKYTKFIDKEKFKDYNMNRFKKRNCVITDIIEVEDDDPVITLDTGDDSDKDDIMIVENSQSDGCSEKSNKENSEINNENEDKIEIEIDIGNEIHEVNDRSIDTVIQNKRVIEIDINNEVYNDDRNEETSTGIENKTVTDKSVTTDISMTINNVKSFNANIKTTQNPTKTDSFKRDKSVLEVKNNNKVTSPGDLLMPHNSIAYSKLSSKCKSAMVIEQLIMEYKNKITRLEVEEVTCNGGNSPYLQCAKYKAKIVTLYKRLCKLTGNGDGDLTKQRVVRLHVVDGHPPGPVKRLEKFLNSTIDETGAVPLPDFYDVIRCVNQSNIVDHLGWSKQDIMKEAIALFTQCGQALRKQRQKREYKDLLSLVKDQEIDDYDPANDDPILHRRLEENKLIAKVNEEEVIEKFVELECLPKTSRLNPRLGRAVKLKPAESSDSDSDESELPVEGKYKIYFPTLYVDRNNRRESSNNCLPRITTQCENHNVHTAKVLGWQPPTIHTNNVREITDNTRQQNVAAKTDVPKRYTDLTKLQKIGACNRYVIAFNSDNHEAENNCNILENNEVNQEGNTSETKDVTVKLETEIKQEPIDIQGLLNNLGDNYLTTIFDIEDPFVVIEISDSSDDDL